MKLFKKKSSHHKAIQAENILSEGNIKKTVYQMDFKEYEGRTVTIYVNAGGLVGNGFTGVMLGQTGTSIRLLITPSTPPSCSLGSTCNGNTDNILLCLSCPFNKNATLGAIAEIPFISIVAFVHNNSRF